MVVVGELHREDEKVGVDEQRRLDQVAVHRVSARAPPGFHFEGNPELRVEGVDFVSLGLAPEFPEQHWPTKLFRLLLPGLDFESESDKARAKRREGGVAGRADLERELISDSAMANTPTTCSVQSGGRERGG